MFADADRAYAYGRAGRAEYWGRLVEATHPAVRGLRAAANADLAADNGTGILVLAEDALLWPAVLEGKKKYAGLAATPLGAPWFAPGQKPYVKGLDFIKTGQTGYARRIGEDRWFSPL